MSQPSLLFSSSLLKPDTPEPNKSSLFDSDGARSQYEDIIPSSLCSINMTRPSLCSDSLNAVAESSRLQVRRH